MNSLAACQSYLAKLPPAISGAGGHPATFRAACECVRFGLGDGDAMRLLGEWNASHCQPPWTEKDLAHKLAGARRKAGGQVRAGRQPTPSVRVIWKITRKTPAEPVKPPPAPEAMPEAMPEPTPEPTPADAVQPPRLWPIRPGLPIPARFADVLLSWTAFRQHPAWQGHPQNQ